MPLDVQPSKVSKVLLVGQSEWLPVRSLEPVELAGLYAKAGKAVAGYHIAIASGEHVYAAKDDLQAVALREKALSPEELAEAEAERQAEESALYEKLHYCLASDGEEALAKQNRLCAKCGAGLDEVPVWHLVGGVALCRYPRGGCSPFAMR